MKIEKLTNEKIKIILSKDDINKVDISINDFLDDKDVSQNILNYILEKAEKEIVRIEKQRGNHYKYYTGKEWKDFKNYDICINSDALGVEKTADMICEIVRKKEASLV